MTVRPAHVGDLEVVVAFNAALAEETEGLELDRGALREGVRRALDDPNKCLYFVAERDGQVIGQCMVTYEWTDWRNGWLWWFQSVYVHRDHRRAGVFAMLYEHVHTEAKRRGDVCGLRLYVHEHNDGAMKTYVRMGMKPSGHLVYEYDWSLL